MKRKELILLIITIIFSCTYLFFANKYVTRNAQINDISSNFSVYNAKVLEITNIEEEEYNLGYDTLKGKLIEFKSQILDGDLKGTIVECKQDISPFFAIQPSEIKVGDKILISESFDNGVYDSNKYDMLEYVRTDTIVILVLIFFAGLMIFGKFQGFLTIISLSLTCISIFLVFIPSILNGHNIYFWSIGTCSFIVIMTLLLITGFNKKSFIAGIGCLSGVLMAGLMIVILSKTLHLTGLIDEQSVFLQMLDPENPIDLKAIIFAGIIIGSVGAIMDVSISIVSALSELHDKKPDITFIELYTSGINIGKDILGTMTNTLILAYIGSSLSIVLLLIANTGSMTYLINTESIIIEVAQSIIGSFGILLALPLTSVFGAYLYTENRK